MRRKTIIGGAQPHPSAAGKMTRAEALRAGILHDITSVALRCAGLSLPVAMTRGLWELIGQGDPFHPGDKRVAEVCYALLYARACLAPSLRMQWGVARLLVFECRLSARVLVVQCAAHPGDHGEAVATLMKQEEDWPRPGGSPPRLGDRGAGSATGGQERSSPCDRSPPTET